MLSLVTGGAGFIGSNLVRRLLEDGYDVRVFDDLSTGSLANLQDVTNDIELRVGDVRSNTAVEEAVAGADFVFHLAALPSVARSVADPVASHEVNVTGTLNVLQAARKSSARKVVYASSSSVYGNTPTLPKHEDMPVSPLSPYAAAKLAGETYCRAFSSVFGLPTVSLRFFNVFGPRQDPASQYAAVIPRFITRMLEGQAPEVFGDGRQTRDFTFVGNATDACIKAALAGPTADGEAMNVGCDDRISLLDLVDELNLLVGMSLSPVFTTPRPGDVQDSQAAIAKARALIGYEVGVDLRTGLAATFEWFADRVVSVPAP
jgi:nucleoside-diphosphate-sugar epimerase